MSTPNYLYKIVSPEAWQASQGSDHLLLDAMDEAFIHLATGEQVQRIAAKFWTERDYLVLKLDAAKLPGRLEYESNPGGSNKYYHLYEGSIPMEAVVEVLS